MSELFCEKKFCIARFCPLVLAYATTVHKFQGFEAGFNEGDTINHEVDTINHIIADMGNLNWEKKLRKTAYIIASRATTIGTSTVNNHHTHLQEQANRKDYPTETRMNQPPKRWKKLVCVSSNGYGWVW